MTRPGHVVTLMLVAAAAVAGCGGSGKSSEHSKKPAIQGKTVAQVESCFKTQGAQITPPNIPALGAEHKTVRARGGGDFGSTLKLKKSSGAIDFFVYTDPAEAKAGAARVKRLVELNRTFGKGTVFVNDNVVGATFLDLPPVTERGFKRCT